MSKQTGRKALIILSDGVDRNSKENLVRSIEAAQRANTIIYAIYFKGEEPRQQNNNQQRGRGGYPAVASPEAAILAAVAATPRPWRGVSRWRQWWRKQSQPEPRRWKEDPRTYGTGDRWPALRGQEKSRRRPDL